ncbi:tripartite tricarboxylate transporter substrate binding protein [Noviherbaspirillum sp. CPCC 100848]|uniref:Tripartite tricarboxylate transporter substrate binding protein n=1 Tax=Noviherbaspirillum album TaxID=3080276 RepID=A0ABU6JJF0_9BURK|nr:tripartite tricarboxylate transporter substrate binding protein [Noviherbaspirillum sp. CPCC 100848]MEC4723400.1 tripartite tricarboxylate transporter substrate binding protein [Noviherbaspirillum sp. CPCC 100848]
MFKLSLPKIMSVCLGLVTTVSMHHVSFAQSYPSKPVRLVVPYAPGGLPDTVARVLAQKLQEATKQSFIVDNRPGGNGAVAAANLATSPADGYSLLVTDGSMLTISPLTNKKLPYDAEKQFVPVSLVATSPLFLAVNSSVKAKNFDEFIQLAKSKPGALNYGSSGIGSTHHLTGEAMKAALGIDLAHVPFRGSGASVPALAGNQVEMAFAAYPSLATFEKAGTVRILATNSLKRSSLAPNVPAISEKVPGFDFAVIVGVLAPAGTPNEAISRLSNELAKIAQQKDIVEKMKAAGIEMVGGGPDALKKALDAERVRGAAAVKAAGIQPE